jgi:glycosyltransferase involved in cell wall biosynthesis
VSLPGRVAATTALAAAEVACMPSLREGLSVFCLEAQAAGLPVVASRIGGLPEAVADGETGILVAPGDEVALAAALERLVADGALRSALGEAARRRARQQFDAADMARRTEACYRDVVARHRGGGA